MNQELKTALFQAEAVAHLRGYEREILPLADLARGMDARIAELEGALAKVDAAMSRFPDYAEPFTGPDGWQYSPQGVAREVLARTVKPLIPENLTP